MRVHVYRLILILVLVLLVPASGFADSIFFPVGPGVGGGGGGTTGIITSPTPPVNPTVGLFWYDSSTTPPTLKIWDGTQWDVVGGSGGSGTITGPIPPTNPSAGQLWFDTSVTPAQLRVWDGAEWIVVSNETAQNSGPTAPSNPVQGQLWYDTTTTPATLRVWDGVEWVTAGGPAGVISSPTAPTNPAPGQLWSDTSTSPAVLKIWDGVAWVLVSNQTGNNSGPTAPSNPVVGQIWYDTSTSPATLKVWDGAAWVAAGSGGSQTVVGPTAPSSPAPGQLWYDNSVTPGILKVWDGTAWVAVGAGAGTETMTNLTVGPGAVSITGGGNGWSDQISNVNVNGVVNVKAYGAYGDVRVDYEYDCSLPANSTALTCISAGFKPTDVGKSIFVPATTTLPILGAANNGSGAIRLTVSSTAALNVSNRLVVTGVSNIWTGSALVNTSEANGSWSFAIVNSTQIDLIGSTFTHAWVPPNTGTITNVRAPSLDTTIVSVQSASQVTIGTQRTIGVTGQNILWAHDDTAAIQAAYDDPSSPYMYFPPGGYLSRGQDWRAGVRPPNYAVKIFIDGGTTFSGSTIFSVGVTNPGGVPGATKVGVQHTGYYDLIRGVNFIGGFMGGPDTAPLITVLSARLVGGGYDFNIAHDWDSVMFDNEGIDGYSFFNYGSEQTSWENPSFNDRYSSRGLLYFSACNTPGIVAPYGTMVPAPTSTTHMGITGKKSVLAGWNVGGSALGGPAGTAGMITLDDVCDAYALYDFDFNDMFVWQANSIILNDTYRGPPPGPGGSMLRHLAMRGVYSEAFNLQDRAVWLGARASQFNIQAQFYNSAPLPGGYAAWVFYGGLVDSQLNIDTTGNYQGPAMGFYAGYSCKGSYLNIGGQAPNVGGCDDWLYSNGWDWTGALVDNGAAMQPPSLTVRGTGHIGTSSDGMNTVPVPPTATGANLMPGSSDSVGEAQLTVGGHMTLTFKRPWKANNVACVLTDDGVANRWYTANKNTSNVEFHCVDPATGTGCAAGNWVIYHCFGVGGI